VGKTLKRLLVSTNITRQEFADKCEVSRGYIDAIIFGKPPGAGFLPKLCTTWATEEMKQEMIRAHAYDEIERAGGNPDDFKISISGESEQSILAQLRQIENATGGDNWIFEKIKLLSEMSKSSKREFLIAAGSPADYNPAKGLADMIDPPKKKSKKKSG